MVNYKYKYNITSCDTQLILYVV